MAVRVAVNGFGRIGRLVVRALVESKRTDVDIVAINDLGPVATNAHLLKYDSVHGVLAADVQATGESLIIDGKAIRCFSEKEPKALKWGDLGVDIVAECTGVFSDRDKAAAHLDAGAKRVLVSAPSKGADLTVVYGVNHDRIGPQHKVISNASCTTNCLAPVAHVLHRRFGLVKGFMTTVHAYTGDQCTVDSLHKDLYRSRAAALSMIPTSTGAARAVGEVLPELKGKLDGVAIRVPTANVSLVDLKLVLGEPVDSDAVNAVLQEAANGVLKGVLDYSTLPLVSVDFNHSPASSTVAADGTKVMGGDFVRVMSWYDNEWGFSNRMLDTAVAIGATL